MGPKSKQAVCDALGFIIEEAQAQRVLLERMNNALARIEHALQVNLESENTDRVKLNQRVSVLEREWRAHGFRPSPAE